MKIYVEEIEEASVHGVTNYSLVRGMEVFSADVRASGIELFNQDGSDLSKDHPLYEELYNAVKEETYKGVQ